MNLPDLISAHATTVLLTAAVGLLGVGEAIGDAAPVLGPLSQCGAVGVLAWVAYSQRKEISALRKGHAAVIDKLCERWDNWEHIRHSDAEKLARTLRTIGARPRRPKNTEN